MQLSHGIGDQQGQAHQHILGQVGYPVIIICILIGQQVSPPPLTFAAALPEPSAEALPFPLTLAEPDPDP
mgnify:FL=1